MSRRDEFNQVAHQTPYDNSDSILISDDVKSALDELAQSASPGFSFGRSNNVTNGSWLLNETVPSNKSGRLVYINSAVVEKIFVGTEDVSTYDLQIHYHDGGGINMTLLDTVSVVSSRGGEFTISKSVPFNKQLAIRLVNGSAKNVVAGLELSGTR